MSRQKQLAVIILGIILVGVAVFLMPRIGENKEQVPEEDVVVEEEIPIVEEDVEELVEEKEVIPIDIEYWQSINEDIYAWISIEDTNVSYPILQHPTDNAYYLDHTVDHQAGLPGSIYTENRNTKDFTDFNTLIYGHNMKNGSMFKHLHKFREKEFFDTHDTIMIYTENESLTFQVYAAVIYNNSHILMKYDNSVVEDRLAFIQSLQDINSATKLFREGMTIDENSNLITLATCTGNPDTRLIIVAEKVVK